VFNSYYKGVSVLIMIGMLQ